MNNLSFAVEDYIEQDLFLSTESHEKEETKNTEKKFKTIKIVFGIFCFLLLCELVFFKYITPCMSSPKLTISGQNYYSAEEIAKKLLPMNATSWLDFDVQKAVSILSSDVIIENVSVEKKFPDKILINIVERTPVAITMFSENGRTNSFCVDRSGVLFPCENGYKSTKNSLPIISGLPIEYMSYAKRIPAKYRSLIEQIAEISELPQNYFASISEICVRAKEYGNYELSLIPSQSKVKVLTDRALNEDALKYMMVVLDVVNKIGTDVSEIDLRYGAVAFRTKMDSLDAGE